ncbi:MAG: efflux RND transporter permease subunit [Myxococcota bacterium]
MIERLLRFSLGHRALVLSAAAGLCVLGAFRASEMPVDVFPDLTAPRVTIVTESTGLASEEVERLVTFPIEAAVNGTAGVRRVRSASAPGISLVWVEFDWDTSQPIARQRVTERLQSIRGSLPREASAPLLAPASSVMGEIAFVALQSSERTDLEVRRVTDVEVRPRLLAVEGVSQVVPIGGEVKQYQVLIDSHRIERYQLELHDVSNALREGNRNAPGGYLVERGQESVVRVVGRAQSETDLGAVVVTMRDGVPIRVRDVAEVVVGPAVARGAGSYGGESAIVLSIVKQPDADTLSTTRRVDRALDRIGQDLRPQGIELRRDIFRQQDFIDRAIENLIQVLRDGAILVIVVLFIFLWSPRPTAISVVAIPLSLLSAVLALDVAGFRIDTMTLGGLAIAIGELVDDAIVDVENVARRLRERASLPPAARDPVMTTVFRASLEVRSAIVSATVVLMLVFLPLLFLPGLEGRLLRPLAVSYLIAIFSSLVVAVTVTPVLCSIFLPKAISTRAEETGEGKASVREPPVLRLLSRAYRPVLAFALRRSWLMVALAATVIVAGAAGFMGFGRSFLPEFNEGSLTIHMVLPPGTSLSQSDALGTMAERTLLQDPAVLSVGRRTGRAERDEHVQGVESSEIEVRLSPEDERTKEQLFSDIRERLRVVPGQFTLGQPISHRIEHMISGQRSALSIKVFGADLRTLRQTAAAVESAIKGTPGLVDLRVEQVVDIPQLAVRVDAQAASNYGFSPGAAASAVGTAFWGNVATTVYEDGTATDVVVRYPGDVLTSRQHAERARVPTPTGALVSVTAIAEVEETSGPNYILRENVQRRLVVTANVAGRDARSVYDEVRRRVDEQVERPEGVHIEYAGQFEREEATSQTLLLYGVLVLLAIGFVVGATIRSVRRTLIVLVNLPLAIAGGVVGVYLAGGVLSVATTIGFITLFGIATRNGILLATRARDLELEGAEREPAVARAARERLAPILMTAVTAALGLLPLGLALGEPGSEIQAPMALVILTGIISSTALNMLVVPTLLARWGGPPAGE